MRRNNIPPEGTSELRLIRGIAMAHHGLAEEVSRNALLAARWEKAVKRPRPLPGRYMAALVLPPVDSQDEEIERIYYSAGAGEEIYGHPSLLEVDLARNNTWTFVPDQDGGRYYLQRCTVLGGLCLLTKQDGPAQNLRWWRRDRRVRALHRDFVDALEQWSDGVRSDERVLDIKGVEGVSHADLRLELHQDGRGRWLLPFKAEEDAGFESLGRGEIPTERMPISGHAPANVIRIEENA